MNTQTDTGNQQPDSRTRLNKTGRYSLWRVFLGPIIWTGCFVALYGIHGLACLWLAPADAGTSGVRAALLLIWLASLLVVGLLAWRSLMRLRGRSSPWHNSSFTSPDTPSTSPWDERASSTPRTFLPRLTTMLDVSSWIAVLGTGLPVIFLRICAGPLFSS